MRYRKASVLKGAIIVLIAAMFTGCMQGRLFIEGRYGTAPAYYGPDYRRNAFHIPPGHMPPPGMCRIWYPGVPPGHQPPPGNCYRLSRIAPPGAWLIRG